MLDDGTQITQTVRRSDAFSNADLRRLKRVFNNLINSYKSECLIKKSAKICVAEGIAAANRLGHLRAMNHTKDLSRYGERSSFI